jgi:hypothetical protein
MSAFGRPTYQTIADIAAQENALDQVAKAWRCEWVSLPEFYQCDAALMRGRVILGMAEVKCRNVRRAEYPTLILSVHKWMYLISLHERLGVRGLLVVKYVDGVYWIDVGETPTRPAIVLGGRADRSDSQDIEPCVDIPIDWLHPLMRKGDG